MRQKLWLTLDCGLINFALIAIVWKKFNDPDVTRTRSLLIWSQTRYHCATESTCP